MAGFFQNPSGGAGIVTRPRGIPLLADVAFGVLLDDLQILHIAVFQGQAGGEPDPAVLSIFEKMPTDRALFFPTALDIANDGFFHPGGLGGRLVVEIGVHAGKNDTDRHQGNQNPNNTAARAEHGNDLVRPGHRRQRIKQCQQRAERQRDHNDLGNLRGVIPQQNLEGRLPLDEILQIIGQVENEPNAHKAQKAVGEGHEEFF